MGNVREVANAERCQEVGFFIRAESSGSKKKFTKNKKNWMPKKIFGKPVGFPAPLGTPDGVTSA